MPETILTTIEELEELPMDSVILCRNNMLGPNINLDSIYVKKFNGLWLTSGTSTRDYNFESSHFIHYFIPYTKVILLYRGYEPTDEEVAEYMSI